MIETSPNKIKREEGVWDLDELEEQVIKPNQWAAVGSRTFKAVSVTHEFLPAGCYSITLDRNDNQPIYVGKNVKNDSIITFKDGSTKSLLKEINEFWNKKKVFKENGFLHRRGYMLYGNQGTGKSSIVWQVALDVINRKGVVFVCENPSFFSKGLKTFRQVEPDRPIVCIFEDLDAIIHRYGESEILQLLDGDNQIDRVINIATTNYPEHLDKRLVSRPRRFDRLIKVLNPSDKIRTEFFSKKLPKSEKIQVWLEKTKGLSFASLSEALISVLCLGNTLNKTVEILKDIESKEPKSSDFATKKVGFDDKDEPVNVEDDW